MKTLSPPNYYMGKNYTFQGFIYNPTTFEEEPEPEPPSTTSKKSRFPWVLYANKLRNNRS